MPDEKGETRRERAARFGVENVNTPEIEIPDNGVAIWSAYWSLSSRLRRIRDGVCEPIAPSEFLAWCQLTGSIFGPVEYDMLCAMDDVFCSMMNEELEALQIRKSEEAKQNGHSRNRVRR